MKLFRSVLMLAVLFLFGCEGGPYDIVLEGGRVMDPESGLDGIRNVGIHDGKIKAVTDSKISGKRVIDASRPLNWKWAQTMLRRGTPNGAIVN